MGLDVEKRVHPMSFFTANGVTSTNDVAKIHFDEFESTHTPYVLDESPSVLEGYSFVWPAKGVPYMISPDNKKILLEVEGNIPYIVKDSDFCSPMIDEQTENVSKLITGHIDVSYQPEIIDYEVDPQGFNCDFDEHSYTPQKRKRARTSPGMMKKEKNMKNLKSLRKQLKKMTQMTSGLMSSMVQVGW